jgi:uncharacterized protein (DUF736 family)
MSVIGTLETVTNNGDKEYWGNIKTLKLNLSIRLIENRNFNSSTNSPDFLILGKLSDGSETQVGSAWLKVPNKHDSKINEFISITIDDPSMDAALNVAAFPKEGNKWDITFRRRQQTTSTN